MPNTSPAELVALGELLIDFTQAGCSQAGQALFERNAGGAPANVAVQAARLGIRAQFVGRVGADMHGDYLRRCLVEHGVGASSVTRDSEAFTTLAFVEVDGRTGERAFSFARKPGADTRLCPDDLPVEALRACKVLHVGSLSLTDEPARAATLRAVELARGAGALVSYDPNYRASLWSSRQEALGRMACLLGQADLVKMNEEEARLLCGTEDPKAAARRVLERGASLAAVTLGPDGALVATRSACVRVPSPACTPRDTTGAGDSFWGALLFQLVHVLGVRTPSELACLDEPALYAAARFACAAASLCVERPGGIPAMPSGAEVAVRMAGGDGLDASLLR